MTKRKHVSPEALDASLLPKQRKPIPHAFVLDAISTLSPYTRPMFGCLAIYVRDKIVLILRDKPKSTADNGVWLATTQEHHQSLRREFPNMRSIQVLGKRVTGWQVLPVDAPDFESAALRACELVLAGDPRIGKIPGARTSKSGSKAAGRSSKQIKTSKKHGSTINFDTVRKIGLALPGVEESTAYGSPALKVRGKLLACVPTHRSAEPGSLVVRVGFDDRAELLAAAPDVYYVTDHYLDYSAVLVRLSRVTTRCPAGLARHGSQVCDREEGTMKRERALKIVLALVGLLFTAMIYPLVLFVKQEPALAMMMSLYVTLGIFLIMAARHPSANRSLIAFTAWSSFAHAAVMSFQAFRNLHCTRRTDRVGCARRHRRSPDCSGSGEATCGEGICGCCVGSQSGEA